MRLICSFGHNITNIIECNKLYNFNIKCDVQLTGCVTCISADQYDEIKNRLSAEEEVKIDLTWH